VRLKKSFMNNNLLDQCLAILYQIKDDNKRLETLLKFMEEEFAGLKNI
jgi:hypothetical protein